MNAFLYHSAEVLLCDIQLAFLHTRRLVRLARMARLQAQLSAL